MEQARWMRFASDHHHESTLCHAVHRAGVCTQEQAAQLGRLAISNNWSIPSVGQKAATRRRRALQ